jgi:DNA-binding transcriptional LysR family regulator
MELTEAGGALLERAYRIVTLSDRTVEVARLARDGELGRLLVGYYDSAILDGIPRVVRQFIGAHPHITVGFELVAKHAQLDHVRDGLLHVAFGRDYPEEPGIVRRSVLAEPLYVAVHEKRARDWPSPLTVADLADESFVLYPSTRPAFADLVIGMCLREGFSPNIDVEAADVVSCLAYVALGTAVAVVPESATRAMTDGVTFMKLLDAPSEELSCVYLAEKRAPTLALFVEHLDASAIASGVRGIRFGSAPPTSRTRA